jgi:methyltransferase (TIGR00027 family)
VPENQTGEPDNTAVRTALWRALHVLVDPPPHVFEDTVGLELVAPDADWRQRGDMHPQGTSAGRASIVVRARFIEDLIEEQAARGVKQYVLLGAGLDTFAERKPQLASKLQVFEVDQPATQAWKRRRLAELGYDTPAWLHFVPVNFEAGMSWWHDLQRAGFDPSQPAVVVSTGVSMYLTKEANAATLRQLAALAPGSSVAMTFLIPIDMLPPEIQPFLEMSARGAAASGTPFLSFYAPDDLVAVARQAGFKDAHTVSGDMLNERYFSGRSDGLRTSNGEQILVATT